MPAELPAENTPPEQQAQLERTEVQQEVLRELRTAANSEARVQCFARLVDTLGIDVLLGLIPGIGDAGASGLSGLYLLYEAKKAGLSKMAYLKIIGLQAADFAIGTIPIFGDVADYFFKATTWNAKTFEKHTHELVKKARAAGVAETDIQRITVAAEKLPKLTRRATNVMAKGKARKVLSALKKTA